MKRSLAFLALLTLLPLLSFSQILEPVKWSFKVEQSSPGEATLLLIAKIDKSWHLYSQDIPPDGPIPTTFTFTKSADYELVGKVTESKPIIENDPLFKMDLKFFADKAIFKQKVKILSNKPFTIKGVLEFMCCDDKQCIPPTEVEFTFDLKGNPEAAATPVVAQKVDTTVATVDSSKIKAAVKAAPAVTTTKPEKTNDSLWWFFIISFMAGLVAILTPCVFPMIPMTVTFFMHDSENKRKARTAGHRLRVFDHRHLYRDRNTRCGDPGGQFCQLPEHTLDPQRLFLPDLPHFCCLLPGDVRDHASKLAGQQSGQTGR